MVGSLRRRRPTNHRSSVTKIGEQGEMKAEYLRNGSEVLDFVKGLKATDHVVLFYNNAKDCRQVLFTYLKDGIDKGEAAVYVAGQETPEKIRKEMEEFGMNVRGYEMVGALRVVNYDEWYINNGGVDIPKIMALWQMAVDEAKERNFTGIRACGEMSCFFNHDLVDELVEYEKACNRRLKIPMTAVCAYDISLISPFGEKLFLELLKAHSHLLSTEQEIGFNATLESVDDVLEKALGGLSKEVLFSNLRNLFGLEKEEIPKRFMDFRVALEKTFSDMTARLLENMIFRELYLKLKTGESMSATLESGK